MPYKFDTDKLKVRKENDMSIWTHVAGVIRIDGFNSKTKEDFEKILGKEINWEDDWDDLRLKYNKFLPNGSEGSLNFTVWENPEENSLDCNTITIFGDLRDYDNIKEIEEWFKEILYNSGLMIRQAIIAIECEDGRNKIVHYGSESE